MTTEEAAKAVVECWDNRTFQWSVPAVFLARIANLRTALSASPWVSVKERMPSEADADPAGRVIWRWENGFCESDAWDNPNRPERCPHWMTPPRVRILTPAEDAALRQEISMTFEGFDDSITPTGGLRP